MAVAMTGGVCYLAAQAVDPTYRSEASIVLVPPKSVSEPTSNRFLELGSLTPAVDVLTRALNADETRARVSKAAPDGKYETTVDDATSAPVLVVAAEAPSRDQAQALVDAVLAQAPASLSELQSSLSISQGAEITSISLSRDDPQASQTSRMRAVAALGILCLAGSAVLIGALDGMLLVRAGRKELQRQRQRQGPGRGQADAEDPERRTTPPADQDADRAWFENELATISAGVDDAGPRTTKTSRDGG